MDGSNRVSSLSVTQHVAITIDRLIGPVRQVLKIDPQGALEVGWRVSLAHKGKLVVEDFETPSLLIHNNREACWSEFIDMCSQVDESNPTTCLVLELVNRENDETLASTTLYLYEENNGKFILRQGHYKLLLHKSEADYSIQPDECKNNGICEYGNVASEFRNMRIVEKEYEDGFIEPEAFQEQVDPQAIAQLQRKEAESSGRLYVFARLPSFAHPIYYEEYTVDQSFVEAEMDYPMIDAVELYWKKYRKVFGGGPEGHEPSASAYEYLMELLSRPLTWHWTPEHHALLWKYRYWLKSQEHALPKFILIIDWDDREEVEMVTDILLTWTPPSLWTCWELMAVDGPYLPEDIDLIWAAAFSRSLYDIDYEMLTLFLSCILQYFERIAKIQEFYPIDESGRDSNGVQKKKSAVSLLADLLMDKAVEWPAFAQNLFWSLKLKSKEISTERDTPIAKDNVYARLLGMLLHRLQKEDTDDLDGETPSAVQTLFRQEQVFLKFCTLFKDPRLARISRPQRIELLREITGDPANGVLSFVTLPLPYDASIHVTGTLPDKLTVFKSTAMPVRISFVTTSISEHGIIFKAGEDLRQDIFVLGVLRLFDTIWRGDGLDLRLTPYRCMALSLSDGILEFVPSEPLSNIIAVYGGAGSILSYLNAANLDPSMTSLASTFDLVEKSSSSTTVSVTAILEKVPTSVLETYVRSCAGYCVFTYVLGVGDRHLDNLLLTRDGRFFHVDFAYIFGRDPKPFPPPMKLCKEMVEAMGGPTGALFRRFKSLCFASFCLLRRHARLIVAYLDVCKGDRVATRYVQERLMLDMEELDALLALERLIDDSMTALFPKMFETLHKWAQYWRQ